MARLNSRDPFEHFDDAFDKAFSHPKRTVGVFAAGALILNLIFYGFLIAMVVGGIIFLHSHGVF